MQKTNSGTGDRCEIEEAGDDELGTALKAANVLS